MENDFSDILVETNHFKNIFKSINIVLNTIVFKYYCIKQVLSKLNFRYNILIIVSASVTPFCRKSSLNNSKHFKYCDFSV